MKKVILFTITLSVLGCANKDVESISKSSELRDDGYICEKVIITGSKMPKKVCTTNSQRLASEKNAKAILRRASRGSSGTGGSL